ncbi:uncharacterized protein LOC114518390 [Dendronephthya gigantea]|uniref:uncharacterized protein LOC114518390 n=1 Tax=Dendronephthya gigantea TaxID=151771 RepID=UPI00106C6B71|nr:uncharacterized protein LOC114518390 [Dendronephthya gigantea]
MNISCRLQFSRVLLGFSIVCILLVFAFSQFGFNGYQVEIIPGSLLQRNIEKLPRNLGVNIRYWLSRNIKWEYLHCSQNENETYNALLSRWIAKLSRTIGIMDGQSLFFANTGCLKWLRQFRTQFPKLNLGGSDEDYGAVDHARRFFNDTARKFVERLSEARNDSFDHAINFAGLQTMRADIQCLKAKAILRTLKNGGILYIGHNLERDCRTDACKQCLLESQKIGFTILNKCFWRKDCFGQPRKAYDIYYVLERNFFGSAKDFPECRTGVFVRKNSNYGHTNKSLPALRPSDIYYQC